jgi:AcrR family transcriptional regulator
MSDSITPLQCFPVSGVEEETVTPRVGRKGARTRSALLHAAREVFEAKGYLETRVVDVAAAAGVGHGTFYTYFISKETIFVEVANEVAASLYHAFDIAPSLKAEQRIRATNHRYIEFYRENARMMALIEQVTLFTPTLRELRESMRRHFAEKIEGALRRMNQLELLPVPHLDPFIAAHALGGMVDDLCFTWFVLEVEFDHDSVLDTVDRIWLRSCGVEDTGETIREASGLITDDRRG